MSTRKIAQRFVAQERPEGIGATVRRAIGVRKARNFSPFVLFDHFNVPKTAGFPDHPHRGQETITYILQGKMAHEDFTGAQGALLPGDLQFMTAGRGVMHAEMPQEDETQGIQLWVDLPEKLKDVEPRYRDLKAKDIPVGEREDGVLVKVISGKALGVDSVKDLAYTPVWYLDYYTNKSLYGGKKIVQDIPQGFNALLYVLKGSAEVEGEPIETNEVVFFEPEGDMIEFTPSVDSDSQIIIVAGQILDQDIVQRGPFVSVNERDSYQAILDFKEGKNGFERAVGWSSEIGKPMTEPEKILPETGPAQIFELGLPLVVATAVLGFVAWRWMKTEKQKKA
ncbi:Pirin [Yarrowia sp. C11]|nr:Pirin [Yarrowia sp. E02]KAG5371522.1 Pirin [Yarrowia sp. C11]